METGQKHAGAGVAGGAERETHGVIVVRPKGSRWMALLAVFPFAVAAVFGGCWAALLVGGSPKGDGVIHYVAVSILLLITSPFVVAYLAIGVQVINRSLETCRIEADRLTVGGPLRRQTIRWDELAWYDLRLEGRLRDVLTIASTSGKRIRLLLNRYAKDELAAALAPYMPVFATNAFETVPPEIARYQAPSPEGRVNSSLVTGGACVMLIGVGITSLFMVPCVFPPTVRHAHRIQRDGVTAQAKLIDLEPVRAKDAGPDRDSVYLVNAMAVLRPTPDQRITVVGTLEPEDAARYAVGDPIDVRYLPNEPHLALLVDEDFGPPVWVVWAIMAVPYVMSAVCVYLAWAVVFASHVRHVWWCPQQRGDLFIVHSLRIGPRRLVDLFADRIDGRYAVQLSTRFGTWFGSEPDARPDVDFRYVDGCAVVLRPEYAARRRRQLTQRIGRDEHHVMLDADSMRQVIDWTHEQLFTGKHRLRLDTLLADASLFHAANVAGPFDRDDLPSLLQSAVCDALLREGEHELAAAHDALPSIAELVDPASPCRVIVRRRRRELTIYLQPRKAKRATSLSWRDGRWLVERDVRVPWSVRVDSSLRPLALVFPPLLLYEMDRFGRRVDDKAVERAFTQLTFPVRSLREDPPSDA